MAIVTTSILAGSAAAVFGQTYAGKPGDFNPDGSPTNPYGTLPEALCVTPESGVLSIASGTYADTLRFDKAMTIEATKPAAGEERLARIGKQPIASATLKLITFNTHLFGDAVINLADPLPQLPLNLAWKDAERAMAIGDVLSQEDVDLVALQEVWDPAMYPLIVNHAGFLGAHHGSAVDPATWEGIDLPGELNSGLALLSNLPGLPTVQYFYIDEAEFFESLASKGFLQTSVAKDGFSIGVFNTHMQAEYGSEQIAARSAQIDQLAAAVLAYRQANPSHPVVVMGDFNVIGETDTEYTDKMTTVLGENTGLRDAARNVRCTNPGADGPTSPGLNDLNLYFGSCSEPAHSICLDTCAPIGATCDALCYAAGTGCGIACFLAYAACGGGCTITNEVCAPLCGAAIEACTVGCATANCFDECCGGFCAGSSECFSCTSVCRSGCQLNCDNCVTDCQNDCDEAYSDCWVPCYLDCDACQDCEESCDANHCGSPGPDRRLDYVLYAPSFDGTVDIHPTSVNVFAPQSPTVLSDGSFSTALLSDHSALRVEFTITR